MTRSEWLDAGWAQLPRARSRIGPEDMQRFDLQVAADLDRVARALEAAGWRSPPEPDQPLVSLLGARTNPLAVAHFARDFSGRPENLVRVLPVEEGQVAVIRMWSSGARLEPDGLPVWLGQLRLARVGRFMGIFNRWEDVAVGSGQRLQWLDSAFEDLERFEVEPSVWLLAEPGFSDPFRRSVRVPEAD